MVCNPENSHICESDMDYPNEVIQTETDFETWEIAVLIIITLAVLWAVVASGMFATYVYTMVRPLPEAQNLIND